MNFRNPLLLGILLFCIPGISPIKAQLVKDVNITSGQAQFQMIAPNAYIMEIVGPSGYYHKEEIEYTRNISISNIKKDGNKFVDGLYKMQLTPIVTLTQTERKELRLLSDANDIEKLAAYRIAHNLPEQVDVFNINFSIRNGQFLANKKEGNLKMPSMVNQWQQDHPELYASINEVNINYGQSLSGNNAVPAMDYSADDAQVFTQDVIVQGSICVGFDCSTSEAFGSDTQRLKENNLRIHFDDTSNSASFPGNDWRITINDQTNGGANYFAIEDATAGRIPFRIEGGAPANALYVDDAGNVGIGTSTPVVEAQITDGDSPTVRLEQNGSSGFGSQTWDIAGNETNFFIRDVTNGSLLPFRIKPSAPKNSIYIDSDGDIGLGTETPTNRLQVESGNLYVKAGNVGINVAPNPAFSLNVSGLSQFTGTTIYAGDVSYQMTNGVSFLGTGFSNVLRVDGLNQRVGIGTPMPMHELEVCGTIATTQMSVTTGISCSSDLRFKKNILPLVGSLDKLMQLRGVSYDWRIDEFPAKKFNEKSQIGFIAQEVESLFPELVSTDVHGYKSVDYTKVTPVLVEAIKAQQNQIEQLQNELTELQDVKTQIAALTQAVAELNSNIEDEDSTNEAIGEKE